MSGLVFTIPLIVVVVVVFVVLCLVDADGQGPASHPTAPERGDTR